MHNFSRKLTFRQYYSRYIPNRTNLAKFVDAVRRYLGWGYDLEAAIDHAIDKCVSEDKIADIVVKNRAEVKNMFLTDFDEKKYRKILARDAKAEGREMLNKLAKQMIQDNRLEDFKKALDDWAYQDQLLEEYGIGYADDKNDIIDPF